MKAEISIYATLIRVAKDPTSGFYFIYVLPLYFYYNPNLLHFPKESRLSIEMRYFEPRVPTQTKTNQHLFLRSYLLFKVADIALLTCRFRINPVLVNI